jgi:hypothetical protein
MSTSGNITSVTDALNVKDFNQARNLVAVQFPNGNQPLLDAIAKAEADDSAEGADIQAAIDLAGGN